jgi:hypothetical protein
VPRHSDLDTIVATALRWHENQRAEDRAPAPRAFTA